MLSLSIIIPTRNRANILAEALRRLQAQDVSVENFEVIVIDDASVDGTDIMLERKTRSMPNLIWRRVDRTAGSKATAYISHRRNLALELARGRVIVSIDDDCFVRPDFLRLHLAGHESRSPRLITGPIIDVRAFPSDLAPETLKGKGWHNNPIPGGNFSVLRELLLKAGGFDENFIHYGWEDLELYERLRNHGVARVFNAQLPVFHYKPDDFDTDFATRIRREIHRGAMGAYFYSLHPRFVIGIQTKQHPVLRMLAHGMDSFLGLRKGVSSVIENGRIPESPIMRALLREYAEIEGRTLVHLV